MELVNSEVIGMRAVLTFIYVGLNVSFVNLT